MFLLVGLVVGVLWALPLDDVRGECPPSGEGYGWCAFQKSWAPASVLLLAPVLFASVLATFLLDLVPSFVRHWRAGERPTRMTRAQEAPPYAEDPFLLGAVWGERTGRADGPSGSGAKKVEPTDFVGRGRARRGA